ncbi:hypothetical protein FRB98_001732 [Tulasnella sp. 332]|nr:hypothetical protein FRB98_001732 [Tulasnella sp. 332]
MMYIASITLASVALAFYLPVTLVMFFNLWKWGGRYMLYMAIGSACYCVGLAFRYPLHSQPDSIGIYIGMDMFIVLSPCAFIATVYILLGRLAGELRMGQYLFIGPTKLAKYFVVSDLSTFLIQGNGAGLLPSRSATLRNIFLVGLAMQLISFIIFTCIFVIWGYRVRKHSPGGWVRDRVAGKPWYKDWRALAAAMLLSCAGILVRSLFRVMENGEGFEGRLTTTESYFYCLDCLPLFLAIVGYLAFWPSNFISNNPPLGTQDGENHSTHELTARGHPFRSNDHVTPGGRVEQRDPDLEVYSPLRDNQTPL